MKRQLAPAVDRKTNRNLRNIFEALTREQKTFKMTPRKEFFLLQLIKSRSLSPSLQLICFFRFFKAARERKSRRVKKVALGASSSDIM